MQYYHNVKAAEALLAAGKGSNKSFDDAQGTNGAGGATAQDVSYLTGNDDNNAPAAMSSHVGEGAMVVRSESGVTNKGTANKNRYIYSLSSFYYFHYILLYKYIISERWLIPTRVLRWVVVIITTIVLLLLLLLVVMH